MKINRVLRRFDKSVPAGASDKQQYRSIRSGMHSVALLTLVSLLSLSACSLSDIVNTDPPPGVPDPDAVKNANGAMDLYRGAISEFRNATTGSNNPATYVVASGLISDELTSGQYPKTGEVSFSSASAIDSRNLSENERNPTIANGINQPWRALQRTRITAMNAIAALRKYAPNAPRDHIGHAFALWGMSELMLANLYCSGIPLTTIEFEGGYVYKPGSSSVAVYEHALAMFDSALVYAVDSAVFRNFAQVGKGWALLNLNRYSEISNAVSSVPNDFVYYNRHSAEIQLGVGVPNFTNVFHPDGGAISLGVGTVADREGLNGLRYILSNDPRTVSTADPSWQDSQYPSTTVYAPERWVQGSPGDASIVVASGVEARLLEAEAQLKAGSPAWIETLNSIRNSGFTTSPGSTDTTWLPGSGASLFNGALDGLPDLKDPGTASARVDLLFSERAFWLFLTGRRHNDMRRLIRQYGRAANTVFPTGAYPTGPIRVYGSSVNLPAPFLEIQHNTEYTGCINRDA